MLSLKKNHYALQFFLFWSIKMLIRIFYFTVIFHRSYTWFLMWGSFEVRRVQSTGCSSIPLFRELTFNSINSIFKHDCQTIKGMFKTWCRAVSITSVKKRWSRSRGRQTNLFDGRRWSVSNFSFVTVRTDSIRFCNDIVLCLESNFIVVCHFHK